MILYNNNNYENDNYVNILDCMITVILLMYVYSQPCSQPRRNCLSVFCRTKEFKTSN